MAGTERPIRWYLALIVLVLGVGLIVDALVRGSAQASIIIIVPVLSGNSPEFLLGTLLMCVGLLAVFLTSSDIELDDRSASPDGAASRSGGVVLVGPVPIFFGEWRQMGQRGVWGWIAAGAIATAVLALLFVWVWVRG
jgi:uncharacterized protein (TIGR00304 family)